MSDEAAKRAYMAYYRQDGLLVPWEGLDERDQRNWRAVAGELEFQQLDTELVRVPVGANEIAMVVLKGDDIDSHQVDRVRAQLMARYPELRGRVMVFGLGSQDDIAVKAVQVRNGDILVASLGSDWEYDAGALLGIEQTLKSAVDRLGVNAQVAVLDLNQDDELELASSGEPLSNGPKPAPGEGSMALAKGLGLPGLDWADLGHFSPAEEMKVDCAGDIYFSKYVPRSLTKETLQEAVDRGRERVAGVLQVECGGGQPGEELIARIREQFNRQVQESNEYRWVTCVEGPIHEARVLKDAGSVMEAFAGGSATTLGGADGPGVVKPANKEALLVGGYGGSMQGSMQGSMGGCGGNIEPAGPPELMTVQAGRGGAVPIPPARMGGVGGLPGGKGGTLHITPGTAGGGKASLQGGQGGVHPSSGSAGTGGGIRWRWDIEPTEPVKLQYPRGTCPECGHAGEFRMMALTCPVHGTFGGC